MTHLHPFPYIWMVSDEGKRLVLRENVDLDTEWEYACELQLSERVALLEFYGPNRLDLYRYAKEIGYRYGRLLARVSSSDAQISCPVMAGVVEEILGHRMHGLTPQALYHIFTDFYVFHKHLVVFCTVEEWSPDGMEDEFVGCLLRLPDASRREVGVAWRTWLPAQLSTSEARYGLE
ncbi:MAG: hypothetical protein K6T83_15075 [Alicyclobacillus sp.]|nr:hypothetical protein [Alicyclobacillus sp.]